MFFQMLLVTSLLLSAVFSTPLYKTSLADVENKPTDAPSVSTTKANLQLEVNAKESPTPAGEGKQSNDLTAQETFYPVGGVWWGVRPWGGWGGWGGYRPWHGWHGWHGWHRPHWGGHWGGQWGGHWGGGGWGRTSS